jgi:amidase
MGQLENALDVYDATALAKAIRRREFSVEQVVNACFARIDKLNQNYNPIVTTNRENALHLAKQADQSLHDDSRPCGPLHGVPITVKDSISTADLRTTSGLKKLQKFVPKQDADAVRRLKEAGAIIVGKTNCPTLCSDIQTSNKLFGVTSNPWDVARTSGGSSGGEATAIALGMSVFGIGSDTGGSIRIPASYCGIYGFKPSHGKISSRGHIPPLKTPSRWQDRLTVIGPLARSVRDLRLCYELLSDDKNTASEQELKSPRIAWTHNFNVGIVDDDVKAVMQMTLQRLREQDIDLQEVKSCINFSDIVMPYRALFMYEFFPKEANYLTYYKFWSDRIVRTLLQGGVDAEYKKLDYFRNQLSHDFDAMMKDFDCWILPATPSTAFTHRTQWQPITLTVEDEKVQLPYLYGAAAFMLPFSIIGNPTVVIPVGRCTKGLPIAIQVIGKKDGDRELLQCAQYIADRIGYNKFSLGEKIW